MLKKNRNIFILIISKTNLPFITLLSALFIQCKVAAPQVFNAAPETIGFAEYLDIKSQIDFNNLCSEPNLIKMSKLVEYHEKIVHCICEGNNRIKKNTHKINLFLKKEKIDKIDKKCLKNLKNRFELVSYEHNEELIKTVDSLVDLDQKYRSKANEFYIKKGSKDSVNYYMSLQNRTDSTNMIALKDLVRNFGWPGRFQIGTGGKDLTLLVIHSSEENNSFFLNILIKEARNQNVHWLKVVGVVNNIFYRFSKGGYNELSGVYINNGSIDRIKSLLALYSLSSLINNNPYVYHIFINSKFHSNNAEVLINALKAELKSVNTNMSKVRFHFEAIDNPSIWPFLIQTTKTEF